MADVSVINANGVNYNVKDATARAGVAALQLTAGSNYIKFPDGTMIAWLWKEFPSTAFDLSWGSLYYSGWLSMGNWPVDFYAAPYVTLASQGSNNDVFLGTANSVTKSSAGQVRAYKPATGNDYVAITAIGIGRWKA